MQLFYNYLQSRRFYYEQSARNEWQQLVRVPVTKLNAFHCCTVNAQI